MKALPGRHYCIEIDSLALGVLIDTLHLVPNMSTILVRSKNIDNSRSCLLVGDQSLVIYSDDAGHLKTSELNAVPDGSRPTRSHSSSPSS